METLNYVLEILRESLSLTLSYVTSPSKRAYFLYLLSSLLLAYYVYKRSGVKIPFFAFLFKKKIWLGKSAMIDYGFVLFNSVFKVILIAPLLVYSLNLTEAINTFCINSFGTFTGNWSVASITINYTITIIVVTDLASYTTHFLMHKIPFLWKFHKVHHSATTLNPFTQYRIHPVELLINNFRSIIIKGIITGVFLYLGNGSVSLLTFLGINILNFAFMFFGANLRHSHIKLRYFNFLEYVLISPYQHQIHHSDNEAHFNTNMGSRLAIWDYVFGTLVRSKDVNKLSFGLGARENRTHATFWNNLWQPFLPNSMSKRFQKK